MSTSPAPSGQSGIRINGQPATADDVIAIGRAMDAEDGGYPAPSCAPGEVERLRTLAITARHSVMTFGGVVQTKLHQQVADALEAYAAALSPQGLDAKEGGKL